jgi:histidine triad (HIT) family protein
MPSIFTQIINRDIPADIIYEDSLCIAFLDINPVTKGHALLVPKTESRWIQDVDAESMQHLSIIMQKIIRHMKSSLECDYVRVYIEGMEVDHTHIHLIPSISNVSVAERKHTSYSDGEKSRYAKQLFISQ